MKRFNIFFAFLLTLLIVLVGCKYIESINTQIDNNPTDNPGICKPLITLQPKKVTLVTYGQNITLTCEATCEGCDVNYQWYECDNSNAENGIPVTEERGGEDYDTKSLKVQPLEKNSIHYFYCVCNSKENTNYDEKFLSISNVACVVYTGLPIIQIETVNKEEPSAEVAMWPGTDIECTLKNATKIPGRVIIYKDEETTPIYDSGEYEKKKSGCTIKLRGNTSAVSEGKKPYKIKLEKKADLLGDLIGREGDIYKDKEWILLKDATSLNSFIGLTVAALLGNPWTPAFAFVNVIINDEYRGIYLLIEAVNKSQGRVTVENNGYIIERDPYWWNEEVFFRTDFYEQEYTFKYPDEDDVTLEIKNYIKNYMDETEIAINNGTYEEKIDINSFARWLLIHDILGTWDGGGSNIYLKKNDNTSNSKLEMSTPWDFDTICDSTGLVVENMTNKWSNIHEDENRIFYHLLNNENASFLQAYKTLWENNSSNLVSNIISFYNDFFSGIRNSVNTSRQIDAILHEKQFMSVEAEFIHFENWFTTRVEFLDYNIPLL